jgi:hypothetical protein
MAPEPEPTRLDELRARLRDTQEAAQRLAEDIPASSDPPHAHAEAADEIAALVAVLRGLRDAMPDDLWEQVREIVRQLLLLLRALLDLVVERLGEAARPPADRGRFAGGPDLQDIPIT